MILTHSWRTAVAACLFSACCLFAQETASEPERRLALGARVEYDPFPLFKTSNTTSSTTKPIADYTFLGSSSSPRLAPMASVEYRLFKHVSLGLEFCIHQAGYAQVTEVRNGKKDPNASTDTRPVTTITERTRASYWEAPLMARYYRFRKAGLLSKIYASAGVQFRHVGNIRTGTEYSYADGTTDYNEIAAHASRINQLGFVAGAGMRFLDAFRIRVAPEVRYIRWLGATFQGPAYRSATYQVEAGLSISY